MRVQGSYISCGLGELIIDRDDSLTKRNIDNALSGAYYAMVMTVVPNKDKRTIAFLRKHGFSAQRKPTSATHTVLVRNITAKERRKMYY